MTLLLSRADPARRHSGGVQLHDAKISIFALYPSPLIFVIQVLVVRQLLAVVADQRHDLKCGRLRLEVC